MEYEIRWGGGPEDGLFTTSGGADLDRVTAGARHAAGGARSGH
jgi:hypothetical protein